MLSAEKLVKKNIKSPYIDTKQVQNLIKDIGGNYFSTFVRIFQKYDEFLKQNNLIDLEDVLLYTALLFIENKEILEKYQEKFKYILINEYQDTNQAQYIFIKELASKYKNLAAVGDDSQSIFKFRGSDIRNILNFEKEYPNALVIKLEENYRSTKTILQVDNEIIEHNEEKKEKNLYTSKETGEKVKVYKAELNQDEAEFVANEIEKLIASGKEYKDIDVFYKTSNYPLMLINCMKKLKKKSKH